MMKTHQAIRILLAICLLAVSALVHAQGIPSAQPGAFPYQDGEHLYRAICQGCHMPDAKGAQGAGAYPALATNPRLASNLYPVSVVWNGKNGMPPVGRYLSDAQIAAVVNYVRTNFGNDYRDTLSAQDVKQISKRP